MQSRARPATLHGGRRVGLEVDWRGRHGGSCRAGMVVCPLRSLLLFLQGPLDLTEPLPSTSPCPSTSSTHPERSSSAHFGAVFSAGRAIVRAVVRRPDPELEDLPMW